MIYKADWLSFFTVLTFMCIMLPARATKGYITAVPAPNSSGLIVVAKDKKVTFTIHAGNDTTGASTATFVNGTPPNTNSVTGSIDVTFGTNADGHTNLCTFNMVTKGSTSETCSTNPPIKFNVVVPKVTMSGSSPIKVGITANGHDRKQPFSANIEPASAVSLITLYGDAKITLSDFKPGDGEMDFKMVGVTASSTAGDSSIMAKITASGDVLSDASFPVSVVIPGAVGTPHPTYDSDVTGVNVALDATTAPSVTGLPPGDVYLCTKYGTNLSIPVVDQLTPGSSLGSLYDGANVTEGGVALNVTVSGSSYPDALSQIPPKSSGAVVARTDSSVAAWLSSSTHAPLSNGTYPYSGAVEIDGYSLNPAIVNRTQIYTTPAHLQVTWP